MNRIIKFRGWHLGMKKMLYPPSSIDSMPYVRDSEGNHVKFLNLGKEEYEYYPATMDWEGRQYLHGVCQGIEFMQYTGVKCIEGKDIYEGDIVLLKGLPPEPREEIIAQITWENLGFVCKRIKGDGFISNRIKPKIIGNIFENADLLI